MNRRTITKQQVEILLENMKAGDSKYIACKKAGIPPELHSLLTHIPKVKNYLKQRTKRQEKRRTHEYATRNSQKAPQWALDQLEAMKPRPDKAPNDKALNELPKYSPRYKRLVR